MQQRINCIFHITTACNFNCSYCDVIKDNKRIHLSVRQKIIDFINRNHQQIESFKFFWGEPLIAWNDIKYIIDHSSLQRRFSIVTNTSLLNEDIFLYFKNHFWKIFLSIDTENPFDSEKIVSYIEKYGLKERIYFNVIVQPESISLSMQQIRTLYQSGMRGFNILPVYYVRVWTKDQLRELSSNMKELFSFFEKDSSIRLYWFQENGWYDSSLFNNVLFINIDGNIYFSDLVSTFLGDSIKKELFIGELENFSISNITEEKESHYRNVIYDFEQLLYTKVQWQKELHKLMDYFSIYLNHKNR